jgi:ribosomal protein L7Ae-like RNA K-turn-binding protein
LNKVFQYIGLAKRAGQIVVGADSVYSAMGAKKVHMIFVASDSSQKTLDHVIKKAFFYQVPVIQNYTTDELSKALGSMNSKVVGLTDEGFSKAIAKVVAEGENKHES